MKIKTNLKRENRKRFEN